MAEWCMAHPWMTFLIALAFAEAISCVRIGIGGDNMIVAYNDFEIDVKRERCMAGYPLVYYSVFRISDGWELTSGCYDTADSVRSVVGDMKRIVDNYLENPRDYDDD
jgi:hypothetical protein